MTEADNNVQKVVVIGHTNPDTDSICAAIAYAELKNRTSDLVCEPRRAGRLNAETSYVLQRFGVPVPRMCTDVNPKVRNVDYRRIDGISRDTSMRAAWEIMRDQQIDTLAVVDDARELEGLITVKGIAMANMDVFDNRVLAKSRTTYRNILSTLNGTMLVGSEDGVCDERARVIIGAASPELLENTIQSGDIVILSNRYESQLCAIEMEASLIIVCQGAKVGKTIVKLAEENGVAIMSVPCDTYAAGKLISQCAPIGYFMDTEDLLKFTLLTTVDDAIGVMAKVRHRYFPILDEEGKYCGMLSRRNILSLQKRRIILVDHNESTQAVEGFEQSEILEIIDHHRLADIQTTNPIYVRNEPVGSTNTILAGMYQDRGLMPSKGMAGMMAAAILSDTVMFKSPTCTERDRKMAERLARMADISLDELGKAIFSGSLGSKTAQELLFTDYKEFHIAGHDFAVSQITCVDSPSMLERKTEFLDHMNRQAKKEGLTMVILMLTDVLLEGTQLLYVGDDDTIQQAFGVTPKDNTVFLPRVMSRKKQIIPMLSALWG